jgi:holo-[acyl-carrier protein] synthase
MPRVNIGTDIVQISRVSDKIASRILTAKENELYNGNLQFLAGRFAAKEAIAKALGTGIGASYSFGDIEILRGERGEPIVYLKGQRAESIKVSISHEKEYAVAVALIC